MGVWQSVAEDKGHSRHTNSGSGLRGQHHEILPIVTHRAKPRDFPPQGRKGGPLPTTVIDLIETVFLSPYVETNFPSIEAQNVANQSVNTPTDVRCGSTAETRTALQHGQIPFPFFLLATNTRTRDHHHRW